ncbi:hypothetical protein N9A21_06235 [Methylophilaceae bacterium]|nr:hypothetical protein [Methylophilaceae bacterium]
MENDVKKTKAIRLDNSTLFDIHKLSEYKEVDICVAYLFNILSKKIDKFKRKNPSKNKSQLKTLIVNLYKNYLDDKTRYVSIYLGKSYYDNLESRYNKLFISRIMIDIVHALDELGFIRLNLGYYSLKKSRISRIIGTDKLFKLFTQHQFSAEMIQTSREKELIVMRDIIDGKKLDISYEDTPSTNQWRDDLKKYNDLLAKTYIDIPQFSEKGIALPSKGNKNQTYKISLNQSDKIVQRIFNNNSWEDGGRFYGGWWQRIPSGYRGGIHFSTMPTSELDFSGLHINLIYLLCKKDFPKSDPYDIHGIGIEGLNRQIVKIILLHIINAKSRESAVKSITMRINFDKTLYEYVSHNKLDYPSFIDEILITHKSIKKYFFSGQGIKLQNFDAMMAEKVINHFTNLDIPVLCIHDSFLIAADKTKDLNQVMTEKYGQVLKSLGLESDGIRLSTKGMPEGLFHDMLSRPEYRDMMIDKMHKLPYDYPIWTKKLDSFNKK